ncbi:MAG: broad specificity phosphatase PhoE [bacterium]|jgi:broad specificity phosphatase PhoE
MSKIYFVRHGQASFGSENYDRLSDLGRVQVQHVAEHFFQQEIMFDAVYSGSLERQIDTAEIIRTFYQEQGVTLPKRNENEGLNEYDSDQFLYAYGEKVQNEGIEPHFSKIELLKNPKQFQRFYEQAALHWIAKKLDMSGLKTWEDYQVAVNQALNKVQSENQDQKNILIASSGGPLSFAVQKALQLDDEQTLRLTWQTYNSGVTQFIYNQDGEYSLSIFNSIAHLEQKNKQQLITQR